MIYLGKEANLGGTHGILTRQEQFQAKCTTYTMNEVKAKNKKPEVLNQRSDD
jgi:hypothetical protein